MAVMDRGGWKGLRVGLISVLWVLGMSVGSFGDVIIGNLPQQQLSGSLPLGQFSVAVLFNTGSFNGPVDSVDLELEFFDPSGVAVALYLDNGRQPGTRAGSFVPPKFGGADRAVYHFPAQSEFQLLPGASYWLIVSAPANNPSRWDGLNIAPTGMADYDSSFYLDPATAVWRSAPSIPWFNLYTTPSGSTGGSTAGGGGETPPKFVEYHRNPDRSFHLELTAQPNITYVLLSTHNLAAGWLTLTNLTSTNGVLTYDDPSAATSPVSLYRARSAP